MEFSVEHIISVTHDLMLVSQKELIRFLEYMCGKKLLPVHMTAANDFCVKPLVKQFPWLMKIDSSFIENKKRILSLAMQGGSGMADAGTSPTTINRIAEANGPLFVQYKAHEAEWLAKVKKSLNLKPTYEVKTIVQSGFKPWSSAAYTYWWMLQRQKDEEDF